MNWPHGNHHVYVSHKGKGLIQLLSNPQPCHVFGMCPMQTQVPTQSWGNNSCFDCLWYVLLFKLSTFQTRNISPCSFYPQAEIMTRRDEYAMPRVIQVAGEYLSVQSVSKFNWSYLHSELIGEFDDECPRSLLVKLSDEADSSSPLQSINWKLKSRTVEQRLKLTQSNWWVELRVPRQYSCGLAFS